jgi:hypothetical protein
MRFVVTVRMPVEAGDAFVSDPEFPHVIEGILADQKAEAVYFMPVDGQRGILYVTDVPDGSYIPSVVEPWWLRLKADVRVAPAFTREEMQKAGPRIGALVARYGGKS